MPINLFAILFSIQALLVFGFGLADINGQLDYFASRYPGFAFDRDAIIVITSARLTIAAFPVVLVWFFAKSFAKWFCAAFALLRLLQVPAVIALLIDEGRIDVVWIATTSLTFAAVALLFTREAGGWFDAGKVDAATFS